MVSLNYVPFLNKMSMHDITKHELSLVMNYDISNYIMNLKECVNTVMYVFSVSCKLSGRIINNLMAATQR
jgi:hypothetical protein